MTHAPHRAEPRCGRRLHGSALLLTLWLTMVLAMLVSIFAYSVNQEVEWTSWQRKRTEANVLARSALAYLPKLIDEQRKQNALGQPAEEAKLDLERFGGFWRSRSFELGRGQFHLEMRDVEQKLNVNLAPREVWENLLYFTNLSEDDARDWIDSLEDWKDSNDAVRLNGAEDQYYGQMEPPYRAKNAPVSTLGEILWIRMGPELMAATLDRDKTGQTDRVYEFLTVEGEGQINVATAPPILLAALGHMDLQTAQSWFKQRSGPDGIAGTEDDLPVDLGMFQSAQTTNSIVTTQSKYFIVSGVGEVGGVRAARRALYLREGQELKKIRDLNDQIPGEDS